MLLSSSLKALAGALLLGASVVSAQETSEKAGVAGLFPGWPKPGKKCLFPRKRKEWRKLSNREKEDWLDGFMCLSKLPHTDALTPVVRPPDIAPVNTSSSFYDDIVYMHMDLNLKIHFTGQFLPWHRWYQQFVEDQMRTKCGFKGTMPYWDWTKDAHDIYNSPIWESHPRHGLGTWGDPNKVFRVTDGALRNMKLSYPSPIVGFRRNFTIQPYLNVLPATNPNHTIFANETYQAKDVHRLVNGYVGDFVGFQYDFEFVPGSHSALHRTLGGDMGGYCPATAYPGCVGGPTFSPNDVTFFLHHGMVDKIWADWQRKNKKNKNAFFGGSVQDRAKFPNGAPPYLGLRSPMPADRKSVV